MPVSGSVTGGREEVRHIQGLLTTMNKDLAAKLRDRIRPALAPLKSDVPATAGRYMPHRGGYAALLSRSTKVEVRVFGNVKATVRVSASGKRENRDVGRLNRGELRHPLFGRRSYVDRAGVKRSGWFTTGVRRGYVDDPLRRATRRVDKAVNEACDAEQDRLLRG